MKHALMKTAALLFALVFSAAAMAGFEEGLAAYNKNDYATALKHIRHLAQKGNAKAKTCLA